MRLLYPAAQQEAKTDAKQLNCPAVFDGKEVPLLTALLVHLNAVVVAIIAEHLCKRNAHRLVARRGLQHDALVGNNEHACRRLGQPVFAYDVSARGQRGNGSVSRRS